MIRKATHLSKLLEGHNMANINDKEGESDVVYSYGRIGAAYAMTMEVITDGNDNMSPPAVKDVPRGYSSIGFQIVCDPITQAVKWDECKCRKKVSIKYGYFSNEKVFASTWRNLIHGEFGDIKLEEWFSLIVNHNTEYELVACDSKSAEAECERQKNTLVDKIFTKKEELISKS